MCDLACGSGVTALEFAGRRLRVYAVDGSPEMCRLLRTKAKRERVPIRVRRGDMRSFHLPEPVDLITCEFHSLNHLRKLGDLACTMSSVFAALRPGGHFFFDVAHAALYQVAAADTRCYDQDGLFSVRGYEFDRARGKACFEATWFVQSGTQWRRFDERIAQVPWPRRQVTKALRKAGFEKIRCYDCAPFLPKGEGRRLRGALSFFLAQKPPVAR